MVPLERAHFFLYPEPVSSKTFPEEEEETFRLSQRQFLIASLGKKESSENDSECSGKGHSQKKESGWTGKCHSEKNVAMWTAAIFEQIQVRWKVERLWYARKQILANFAYKRKSYGTRQV